MVADKAVLWAASRKYEEILRRDPTAYSYAPLADVYRSLGLLEEALATARKVVILYPDFAAGQMALAKAALESSLHDEALNALEAVVRITPENLEAQGLLAGIYSAAGDDAAAYKCQSIIKSLEPDAEPAPQVEIFAEPDGIEELAEADIMDLTDDLIQEDEAATADQFTTIPERPSIGEANFRPVPFLIEEPSKATSGQKSDTAAVEEAAESVQLNSATIAELYISQGFLDKGIEAYRDLLRAEPCNLEFARRLAELEAPAAPAEMAPESVEPSSSAEVQNQPSSVVDTLNSWLGNIGRMRECRSKSL